MPKIVKDDIVYKATLELISQQGIAATSTKDIAAKAGINEVTIFRKYESKESLIKLSITHLLQEAPMRNVQYTGDIATDLQQIVEAYMETQSKYGDIMPLLILQATQEPELKGCFEQLFLNMRCSAQIILRYQMEGKLKEEHPQIALSCLFGPILATRMLKRALGKELLPQVDIKEYVQNYLTGRGKNENA